jgi:ketosteroid isomerase-like protein
MGWQRAVAVGGVLVGLVLIVYAVFGRPTDEELIHAQLQRLAEAVSFTKPGNAVARGLALKGAFRDIFDDAIRAEIPELGSARKGRRSLVELGLQSTQFARSLSLSFADTDIEVGTSRTTAAAKATAVVRAVTREGDDRQNDRQVHFVFAKTDDGWKIRRFRVIPPDEE